MNWIRLYIYPIVIAILIPVLVFLPYGISIYNEHVDPFLPYTTDTGALAPESAPFSLTILIIALLFAILSYLQNLQLNSIYTLSESVIQLRASLVKNKSKVIKVNRFSHFVAIFIVIAIIAIVSFRSNEFPIIHSIIAITLIIAILVFVGLKSWLSLRLSPQINSKVVAKVRIVIAVLLLLSFIVALVCGIWAVSVTKNTKFEQKLNWNTKDDGYIPHIISAISEWIFVLLLSPFFATYFQEMKSMTIHDGVLRLQFKTKTTLKSTQLKTTKTETTKAPKTQKTPKNKTNQTKM